MKKCPKCNEEINDNWKVCLHCNANLESVGLVIPSPDAANSEAEDAKNNYKKLTKYYPIRVIVSIILFFVLFIVYDYIKGLLWNSDFTLNGLVGFILLKCFLLLGIFALCLLPVIKRHRIILGMSLIFALLIYKIFTTIGVITNNWASAIVVSSDIAFELLGAILGLLIVTNGEPEKIKREYRQGQGHKTSLFLLILSLISVPLTYPFLLLASFITTIISLFALYFVLQLPRIPVVLLVGIGMAPLVAIWASIKAIWVILFHKPDFQSALKINVIGNGALNSAIDEVCNKVVTKKPDIILLHAEPRFFVMQGKIKTLDGNAKGRILAIGAPLLKQLNLDEFKAILAHEFAHFSGKDTIYSIFVFPAYQSLGTALKTLEEAFKGAEGLAANILEIFLLLPKTVLGLYLKYFATIDNTLSRGRELRADLISSRLYGSNNMIAALKKVYAISTHYNEIGFDFALGNREKFFENYEELLHKEQQKLADFEAKEMEREEKDYDSHPTLRERIERLPNNEIFSANSDIKIIQDELNEQCLKLAETYTDHLRNIKNRYENHTKLIRQKQDDQIKEGVKKGEITLTKVKELLEKQEHFLALKVINELEKNEKVDKKRLLEYKKISVQAIAGQIYQRGADFLKQNKSKEAKGCLDYLRNSIIGTPELFNIEKEELNTFIDEVKSEFSDEQHGKDLKTIREKFLSRADEIFKDNVAKNAGQILADAILLPLAYGLSEDIDKK